MGMSDFKEIELLSDIARPDYAIITNIGESHIEYLGTRAGIAEAKLEITYGMDSSGTLIVDGDESLLQSRSEEHTSELQSRFDLVCRLLLEKKKIKHHSR